MEYKKLANHGLSGHLKKIGIIIILSASIVIWCTLSYGLYKLNNEIRLLKVEQDQLIYKLITRHEFNFGYSTEDLYDYYDYQSSNEAEDNLEEGTDRSTGLPIIEMLGGESRTKRLKRDIVGTTIDGVPVNSESYAEVKRKNKTKMQQSYFELNPIYSQERTPTQRQYDSSEHNAQTYRAKVEETSTSPTLVYTRKSRVMHSNPKQQLRRRVIKKPLPKSFNSNSPDQIVSSDVTIVHTIPHRKRHRQRRVESATLRPAIHVYGDVSASSPNYDNYLGNGRMHHYNTHFKNWTKENWFANLGMDDYFELNDGYLRFSESGLYFIYVQIYYVDEHDTNGFGVYKNNELVLQCTTTSHTNHRVVKPNTCYTGSVIAFSNGDLLKVHDIEANRYSIFQKGKSFFGAIKLGEIRET